MVVEGKDSLLMCRERGNRWQSQPCTDKLTHDWQKFETMSTVSTDNDETFQAWKVINNPVFVVALAVKADSSIYDGWTRQMWIDGCQFVEHLRELVGWHLAFGFGGH